MPTYDYKCHACNRAFELFQSIKAKPIRTCPNCGKKSLERLIGTGAALIFKGSGFYQTDYRSENYKKGAEAESKPSAPASADAKPAGDAAKPADAPKKAEGAKAESAKAAPVEKSAKGAESKAKGKSKRGAE